MNGDWNQDSAQFFHYFGCIFRGTCFERMKHCSGGVDSGKWILLWVTLD